MEALQRVEAIQHFDIGFDAVVGRGHEGSASKCVMRASSFLATGWRA